MNGAPLPYDLDRHFPDIGSIERDLVNGPRDIAAYAKDVNRKIIEIRDRNRGILNYIRSVESYGLNKSGSGNRVVLPNPMDETVSRCFQLINSLKNFQYVIAERLVSESTVSQDARPVHDAGVGNARYDDVHCALAGLKHALEQFAAHGFELSPCDDQKAQTREKDFAHG